MIEGLKRDKDIISVIIPIYNVQDYLPRCLDSVINNSYRELEIICINDGSTDNCLEILKSYEKKDSRIHIFSKENGGLSSARNEGLKHCTGKLVAFIDSDDWIHRDYFAVLLKRQQKADYDVVVCNYIRTSNESALKCGTVEDGKYEEKSLSREEYMSAHVTKSYVWAKLYKRECLKDLSFDEKEQIEDDWFNVQFVSRNPNMKAYFVDVPLYGYYIRENSLATYIDRFSILNLSHKCYQYANVEKDVAMQEILYLECLKRGLSARYDFELHADKSNTEICQKLLKDSVRKIRKRKMIYRIFVTWPWLYRTFRIINDPTMLRYEKKVKGRITRV